MRSRYLTRPDLGRIERLAGEGRSRRYIAAVIGCSDAMVSRRAIGLHLTRRRLREERLLRTYSATPRGERDDLARRQGLGSTNALAVTVYHIRRRLAGTDHNRSQLGS